MDSLIDLDPYAFAPDDSTTGRHVRSTSGRKQKRPIMAPPQSFSTRHQRPSAFDFLRERREQEEAKKRSYEQEVRAEVEARKYQIEQTLVEINSICEELGFKDRFSVAPGDMEVETLGQHLSTGYFIRKTVGSKLRMISVQSFFADYETLKAQALRRQNLRPTTRIVREAVNTKTSDVDDHVSHLLETLRERKMGYEMETWEDPSIPHRLPPSKALHNHLIPSDELSDRQSWVLQETVAMTRAIQAQIAAIKENGWNAL